MTDFVEVTDMMLEQGKITPEDFAIVAPAAYAVALQFSASGIHEAILPESLVLIPSNAQPGFDVESVFKRAVTDKAFVATSLHAIANYIQTKLHGGDFSKEDAQKIYDGFNLSSEHEQDQCMIDAYRVFSEIINTEVTKDTGDVTVNDVDEALSQGATLSDLHTSAGEAIAFCLTYAQTIFKLSAEGVPMDVIHMANRVSGRMNMTILDNLVEELFAGLTREVFRDKLSAEDFGLVDGLADQYFPEGSERPTLH